MKIQAKKSERFLIPGDPDKAYIEIKTLTPGQQRKIIDKCFIMANGADGLMTQAIDTEKQRAMTIKFSFTGFGGFKDELGKTLDYNVENVFLLFEKLTGFKEFFDAKMATMIEKEDLQIKAEEKNL